MVLTKEELISALQNEVRILVHLAGKVDKSRLDYRPTAKQRSTLELLQYLSIMGPSVLAVVKTGKFDRETLGSIFAPADAASKAMNFDQTVAAIQEQSSQYARILSDWTDADFRASVDRFGNKSSRGALIVNLVLGGHAAYRTQLFCYLKSCGRDELSTMNLWGGVDG
jgi:hypothetical protein